MQNPNQKLKLLFLGILTFSIFGLTKNASATSYYIDKDSIGGTCNNSNAGTVLTAPWCSISKANSTLTAGDKVYLRAGSYAEQIAPANNGSSGSPITYAKYQTDAVNITYASGDQANLASKNYITLDGLNFINSNHSWIELTGGTHCIIQNCSGSGAKGWTGISFGSGAQYNKILNNTFTAADCTRTEKSEILEAPGTHGTCQLDCLYETDAAAQTASSCPADLIYASWGSSHNIFQGNTFLNAPHMGLDLQGDGDRNIVRGNTFGNTWHSNLGIYDYDHVGKNLVESNIIYGAGSNKEANPYCIDRDWALRDHKGLQAGGGSYNQIIRKNIFYNNGSEGLSSYYSNAVSKYYKWYNNTIDGDVNDIHISCTYECSENIFKNNSLTDSGITTHNIEAWYENGDWNNYFIKNNVYNTYAITNNYKSQDETIIELAAFSPSEFISNIMADPLYTNATTHNYTLQSTSPNIDAGDWLTTITSASGSGTSFVVADSGYFFDGWGISGEVGDTIQLQGQTGTAIITNVDYATHTITVNSTLTWTVGLGVALAYSGSAPDIGAYEYVSSGGDVTAPGAPSGLAVE